MYFVKYKKKDNSEIWEIQDRYKYKQKSDMNAREKYPAQ
jgi:hypothetical protein